MWQATPALGAVCGPSQPSQSLCPTVTKGGNVLRLEVDSQSNQTLGPVPAASAYTPVPLHLGGLPGECGLSTAPRGPGTGVTLLSPAPVVAQLGRPRLGGDQLEASLCSSLSPSISPHTPEPTDTRAGPRTPRHPWPPVYRGCMRNLVVNWSPVTMSHSAGVQGVVGASGCPAT